MQVMTVKTSVFTEMLRRNEPRLYLYVNANDTFTYLWRTTNVTYEPKEQRRYIEIALED